MSIFKLTVDAHSAPPILSLPLALPESETTTDDFSTAFVEDFLEEDGDAESSSPLVQKTSTPVAENFTNNHVKEPRQFFPSNKQQQRQKSKSAMDVLREKLVANEIECMQKITESRLQLISEQTIAAKQQSNFWLTATAALANFGNRDRVALIERAEQIQTLSIVRTDECDEERL